MFETSLAATSKKKLYPIFSHIQQINHQTCMKCPRENPVSWAASGTFCKYVLSTGFGE